MSADWRAEIATRRGVGKTSRGGPLSRGRDRLAAPLLLAIFLAACSPPVVNPAHLPPPAVAITHSAPEVSSLPVSGVANPTPASTPASSPVPRLLELAASEYGPRLILEVEIPAIDVSSPVVAVGWTAKETAEGGMQVEWDSPGSLAGWAVTSALPGEGSNIILYGHNNLYSSIFRDLGKLKAGDAISLKTGEGVSDYRVSEVLFIKITFATSESKEGHQQYLQPTPGEQLTIISCWPPLSNTHRVVVLAEPIR